MTDDPVDLNEHCGMAAQKATDIRRQRFHEFQADQAALRYCQAELEKLLLVAPADSWPEAAAKAQCLLKFLTDAPDAQDPHRKELIAHVLDDLTRLCDRAKEHS